MSSGRLLVSGSHDGLLYRSDDDGSTWTQCNLVPRPNPYYDFVTAIAEDQRSGDLFAACNHGPQVSHDGGISWSSLPSPQGYFGYAGLDIAVDDSTIPSIVYHASSGGSIHMSTDAGGTWTTGTVGMEDVASPANTHWSFAVDRSVSPAIVYAALWSANGGSGAWRTLAPGVWTRVSSQWGLTSVGVDPTNGRVFLGDAWGGVRFSDDRGGTWSADVTSGDRVLAWPTGVDTSGGYVGDFAFDPARSSIYAVLDRVGPIKSIDGGATWGAVSGLSSGYPTPQFGVGSGYGAPADIVAGRVVVGTHDGGVWSILTTTDLPPSVSASLTPSDPNGSAGWYTSPPLLALSCVGPVTAFYSHDTPSPGSWSPYFRQVSVGEGASQLNYLAVDFRGNRSPRYSMRVQVDTVGPTSPVVSASQVGSTTVTLVWTPSVDSASGLSCYSVRRGDGSLVATTGSTNLMVSNLSTATAYTFYVTATDISGNVSSASNTLGVWTGGGSGTAPGGHITGTVTDKSTGYPVGNVQVTAVRAPSGDSMAAVTDTNGHYDIGGLVDDQYTLSFWDLDPAGRYLSEFYRGQPRYGGQAGVTKVTVSSSAGASGIDASLTPAGRITGTVTDRVTGLPLAHVPVVDYFQTGVQPSSSSSWSEVFTTYTDAAGQYDVGRLPTGVHHLVFNTYANALARNVAYSTNYYSGQIVTDGLGTYGALGGTDILVTAGATTLGINEMLTPAGADLTPPVTTLTKSPAVPDGTNGWYKTTPAITLSSSEPGITYWVADATSTASWNTYLLPVHVPDGPHYMSYFSVDSAGNTETVHSCPGVQVDTGAPTSPVLSAGARTSSSIGLSWSAATDTLSGVAGYRVYETGSATPVFTTSSLSGTVTALGASTSHTFTVRSYDVAGNESPGSNAVAVTTSGSDTATATVGTNVRVDAPGGANLIFDAITAPGTVSFTPLPAGAHEAPANFRLLRGSHFEISTDASFTGSITIVLPYDDSEIKGQEKNLKLFHWKNGKWEDCTVSFDPDANTITGRVTSLSPFSTGWPFFTTDLTGTPASSWWGLVLALGVGTIALGGWRLRARPMT